MRGEYIRKAQALEPANFSFQAFPDGSAISRARSTMPNGSCRALSRRRRRPRCRGSSSRTCCSFAGKGAEVERLLAGRNDPAPTSFSNLGRAYAQTGNVAAARAEIDRLETLGSEGFGVGFDSRADPPGTWASATRRSPRSSAAWTTTRSCRAT